MAKLKRDGEMVLYPTQNKGDAIAVVQALAEEMQRATSADCVRITVEESATGDREFKIVCWGVG